MSRIMGGLENKPCEERIKEFRMFRQERMRLREYRIAVLKHLNVCHFREDRKLFHVTVEDKTRNNSIKLRPGMIAVSVPL